MKKLFILLVCFMLCAATTLASDIPYNKYTYSFFDTFDTVITIIGYAQDKSTFDTVAAQAEEQFIMYHQLFDQYHAYPGLTNIYTINEQAAKAPVQVPEALYQLIAFCKKEQPKLHNTVNIAMGNVLMLWHDARDLAEADPARAALPSMEALQSAAQHMDIDNVILRDEDRSVFFKDPDITLNIGAVAKGYATELVAQFMLSSEMPSFIINAGGNVRTGHPPLDGRKAWGVALQDPNATTGSMETPPETLFLHDLSVVTSGDYQRYFMLDGIRYHHIVSPKTLIPTSYMRSVTIVAEDSGLADLLSTTLFLMPYEEGLDFLKDYPQAGAIWVLNDMSVRMTDNMHQYAASYGARPR